MYTYICIYIVGVERVNNNNNHKTDIRDDQDIVLLESTYKIL